jgi:hypothetical protein
MTDSPNRVRGTSACACVCVCSVTAYIVFTSSARFVCSINIFKAHFYIILKSTTTYPCLPPKTLHALLMSYVTYYCPSFHGTTSGARELIYEAYPYVTSSILLLRPLSLSEYSPHHFHLECPQSMFSRQGETSNCTSTQKQDVNITIYFSLQVVGQKMEN